MITKPFVLGLLATACVTAAAGGAYVAVRQNQSAEAVPAASVQAPLPDKSEQAVAETEAVVSPPALAVETESRTSARTLARPPAPVDRSAVNAKKEAARAPQVKSVATNDPSRSTSTVPAGNASPDPATAVERPSPSREPAVVPPAAVPAGASQPDPVVPDAPLPLPTRPQFVEVVVPASSVVGLHVETSITSETARVEDRVEARVTRDVMADGQVAIPAGTRVIGDVTLVERGGKMKDKARLGVRFHTLVLADGKHVPFRTDAIYREGSSPGAESARKIGGAAVGGAILGAIIGGAKGAAIGGATGAAGGSAVVMAGDRNAATLPSGTIVTVRVAAPVAIDVEKELGVALKGRFLPSLTIDHLGTNGPHEHTRTPIASAAGRCSASIAAELSERHTACTSIADWLDTDEPGGTCAAHRRARD